MKKPRHYFNRTYRSDYIYFIGWSAKQFKKYCAVHFKIDIKTDGYGGLTIEIQNSDGFIYVLIWVLDKKDYGSLSHECNHAAAYTLLRVGVKASFSNDEAFTYLSQDLFNFAMGE